MRDAIVFSTWAWSTFNVPERIALALARSGRKVLYCEHPRSIFRGGRSGPLPLEEGITGFRPGFFAERLNGVPLARSVQARWLARQIRQQAESLQLREPFFFYPWLGAQLCLVPHLSDTFTPVHIQMDYGEPNVAEHVNLSRVTLTIPHSVYHQQRGRFGEKIQLIPQVMDHHYDRTKQDGCEIEELKAIPRPRLGYLGPAFQRTDKAVMAEVFKRNPHWHFVSADNHKILDLPNVHTVAWKPSRELHRYVAGFDVGFMPYDCFDPHNLHCLPLKLFEYFAAGLPVVATPIIELWRYKELVYLGDTARDLERAIQQALDEPADSPKRAHRMEIAKRHSISDLAAAMEKALTLAI